MKIKENQNQVSVCCAADVKAVPFGDGVRMICSACNDDCAVEIIDDEEFEERQEEIKERAETIAAFATLKEAAVILRRNLLFTMYEDFDGTIGTDAFLPNGQRLSFVCGTANDRFDLQWHTTTTDKEGEVLVDGECREPIWTSAKDHLPLSATAEQLARWIRHAVLATVNQRFENLRRDAFRLALLSAAAG
jgi:hypothetical protein